MARERLETWVDATLQPEPIPPQEVARWESSRLWRLYYVATGAALIPRRLGGEATGRELANDKRMCRRVAHVAGRLAGWWSDDPYGDGKDMAQDAAQIVFEDWWVDHQEWLTRRITWIATWGVNHDHRTWANRYVELLRKEYEYFEGIFSSIKERSPEQGGQNLRGPYTPLG